MAINTPGVFRNRTRSAKRQMKRIMHTARQRGDAAAAQLKTAYRRLVAVAQASVQQAQQVGTALREQATRASRRVAEQLQQVGGLVEQVIRQTERRVMEGAAVPAEEKVLSIFEPHTAVIRKGKPGRPVEFGRVVWVDEVEGGIISRYAVLTGNPPDSEQLPPSVEYTEIRARFRYKKRHLI